MKYLRIALIRNNMKNNYKKIFEGWTKRFEQAQTYTLTMDGNF